MCDCPAAARTRLSTASILRVSKMIGSWTPTRSSWAAGSRACGGPHARFDEQVLVEQHLVDGYTAKRGRKSPAAWIQKCSEVIQTKLQAIKARDMPVRFLPATPVGVAPSQPDIVVSADRDGHYNIPIPQASGIPRQAQSRFAWGCAWGAPAKRFRCWSKRLRL